MAEVRSVSLTKEDIENINLIKLRKGYGLSSILRIGIAAALNENPNKIEELQRKIEIMAGKITLINTRNWELEAKISKFNAEKGG